MIVGIGIDIVEIDRIAAILERKAHFAEKILTAKELEKFQTLVKHRQLEFLAGRFACKEAYSKAMGKGISEGLGFHQMEILNDDNGKPVMTAPTQYRIHVSISHSEHYAVAQVIVEMV